MRFFLLLLSLFVCAQASAQLVVEKRLRGKGAIYVWAPTAGQLSAECTPEEVIDREITTLLDFAHRQGARDIYFSMKEKILHDSWYQERIKRLVNQARSFDPPISIHFMESSDNGLESDELNQKEVNRIQSMWAKAKELGVAGIHFDIEPKWIKVKLHGRYTIDPSLELNKKMAERLLVIFKETKKSVQNNGQVSASIPMWLDHASFLVSYERKTTTLAEHVIQTLDETTIMAYTGDSFRRAIRHAADEMELGRKHGKKVKLAIETRKGHDPIYVSSLATLDRAISETHKAFDANPAFSGIAVDTYKDFQALEFGRQPEMLRTPEDQARREGRFVKKVFKKDEKAELKVHLKDDHPVELEWYINGEFACVVPKDLTKGGHSLFNVSEDLLKGQKSHWIRVFARDQHGIYSDAVDWMVSGEEGASDAERDHTLPMGENVLIQGPRH